MRYFELGFTDGARLCTDEPSSEGSTDVPVSERRPLLILGYFRRMSKSGRLLLSVAHTFRSILGYTLMLCAMSFNSYIFITMAIGAAVGYYMFGHQILDQKWKLAFLRTRSRNASAVNLRPEVFQQEVEVMES
ncbi:unnamed protein product [Notodromas monacha]|uniref:Copper transport protein n=1 Tax=Notodromas monacha TaxID=399045 RepID=A0A7R9GAB3_9CRUS|nr:unnamed protein product [Notodromas monacha]CAG0913923.1 unnamed protein product [Notodromas monacha]